MSELPKGWSTVSIFELCSPKQWKTISTKSLLDEGYVVYGANGVIGKYNEFTHEHPTLMITCRGATCGNIHLSQPFSYINGNAMALDNLSPFVQVGYLKYYLLGFNFESIISGSAQPQITQKGMEGLTVTLAPLAEQKRIVEKLDDVLTQVDTIKARLDGIPSLLKRFRQSVLASAVSGKLTEEWRGGDDYTKHSLSDDWKWNKVPSSWVVKLYPELVNSRLGKMLDKSKNTGKPTKYLGNINVRWFDVDLSHVQEILVSDKEQLELALSDGDVLICEGGEPGRSCVWDKGSDEIIVFQKALHRAQVRKEILPEWLVYNLKNDADGLILNQLFTGTTIKHLTGKALKSYPIRVPSIDEQKEIVRLVDQYFAFADTIEAQVKKAQARVDNLTQSILAKAFRGELVPQDPNDEPADKLLERIAQARIEAEALAKAAKKAETARKKAEKAVAKG